MTIVSKRKKVSCFRETRISLNVNMEESMISKDIKTPMIVGVALAALANALSLICLFMQKYIINVQMRGIKIEGIIIPTNAFDYMVTLLFFAFIFYIMLKYKGESRKGISTAILMLYCIYRTSVPYLHILSNILYSKRGSAILGAVTILESNTAMLVTPFMTVASVFILIAVGRYGISRPNTTVENGESVD